MFNSGKRHKEAQLVLKEKPVFEKRAGKVVEKIESAIKGTAGEWWRKRLCKRVRKKTEQVTGEG